MCGLDASCCLVTASLRTARGPGDPPPHLPRSSPTTACERCPQPWGPCPACSADLLGTCWRPCSPEIGGLGSLAELNLASNRLQSLPSSLGESRPQSPQAQWECLWAVGCPAPLCGCLSSCGALYTRASPPERRPAPSSPCVPPASPWLARFPPAQASRASSPATGRRLVLPGGPSASRLAWHSGTGVADNPSAGPKFASRSGAAGPTALHSAQQPPGVGARQPGLPPAAHPA